MAYDICLYHDISGGKKKSEQWFATTKLREEKLGLKMVDRMYGLTMGYRNPIMAGPLLVRSGLGPLSLDSNFV